MNDDAGRRNLWINAAFAVGMGLLIIPDFFFYPPFGTLPFWLDFGNTCLDAVLFSTVFFFLKREIRGRERLNEQLARANRQKTEALQLASHDLRNPLNAVGLIAADLAAAPGGESAEAGGQIGSLTREMQDIIEELIGTMALGDGPLRLRCAPVDVAACVAEVVERNRRQAAQKRQPLRFVDTGAPAMAQADAARLKQALDNLLGNAVKFSPPGAPITVSVERTESGVRIEVADEGPGLTASDKANLFKRFQRLSARPTGGEPSSGLGLANARRLVELGGGTIGAESEGPGHGSRFWIELPPPAAAS